MARGVRYRVLNKIAHGGMAEIFLALQVGAEGFQKPVVLKRILPTLAADPTFVRMLVDEAHIASTLNHSNLVQVLDLGKSGDQFFLVLEFVDGWSLEQVRRRAQKAKLKLPLPLALYVVGGAVPGAGLRAHAQARRQAAGHRPPRRHPAERAAQPRGRGEAGRLRHRQGDRQAARSRPPG